MAIKFNVSASDMKRSKVLAADWYPVKITKMSEKASKDGQSMNTIVEMTVAAGTFIDVPLIKYFNEKAPGTIIPFLKALGVNISEAGGEFALDEASVVGKHIEAYVKPDEYQGKTVNSVQDFRPAR